jgi:nucleoside 2-deoxyribosyltransferase
MRIFLSGPMTGLPNWNFPLFNETARRLREAGFEVLNPAENNGGDPNHPGGRCWYMRRALELLLQADAVLLLPNWEHSVGALLELDVALACGMTVFEYSEMDAILKHEKGILKCE